MNREQKGLLYENLVREGDKIQRQISSLRSTNIGIDDTAEKTQQIAELNKQMAIVEARVEELMRDEYI